MTDPELLSWLEAVVARAWSEGCPMAAPGDATRTQIALRRWRSFARRNRIKNPTQAQRRDDLARGLCARYYEEKECHGPIFREYQCLAGALAIVLDASEHPDAEENIRAILEQTESHQEWFKEPI